MVVVVVIIIVVRQETSEVWSFVMLFKGTFSTFSRKAPMISERKGLFEPGKSLNLIEHIFYKRRLLLISLL